MIARSKTSALSAAESSPVVGLDSPVGQTGMRGLLRRTGTGLGVFRQERRASKEDVATECGDAIEVNRHVGFARVEGARERLQVAESNVKKLTMGVNAFWSVFNNEKTEAEKRKKNKEMLIDNLLDAMYHCRFVDLCLSIIDVCLFFKFPHVTNRFSCLTSRLKTLRFINKLLIFTQSRTSPSQQNDFPKQP